MKHSEDYPEGGEMEMTKNKVSYVGIKKAINGYIVSWDEQEEKKKGCMDHRGYMSQEKLFSLEEEDNAYNYFMMYKKAEVEYDYKEKMGSATMAGSSHY